MPPPPQMSPGMLESGLSPQGASGGLLVMAPKTRQVSLCRQRMKGDGERLSLALAPPLGLDSKGGLQVEQSSGPAPSSGQQKNPCGCIRLALRAWDRGLYPRLKGDVCEAEEQFPTCLQGLLVPASHWWQGGSARPPLAHPHQQLSSASWGSAWGYPSTHPTEGGRGRAGGVGQPAQGLGKPLIAPHSTAQDRTAGTAPPRRAGSQEAGPGGSNWSFPAPS